ncbi:MAG: tRNA 2-thiocytidine biosynthesis protein TtcA [Oscillospiraceae bacterium]|jgi:tRNA(Ile)-lysidine synthase TilS/MesJ|nr:tRNA 2-thiocytidine biosynthesis protein TtcA [Oscillospiraceae bacterium]MBQ5739543.1 tRNA 2-thiocytidine biosynthesis protein TtcA [Oscillospiraceae bacterium]
MQEILGLVRRCIDDYAMIQDGETVAVGVSGGKDSLLTLAALAQLRRFYPKKFDLAAITIDPGIPGMSFDGIAAYCEELGVRYIRVPVPMYEVVFLERKEKNPCSLCAKLRRGALSTAMNEHGIKKIALGHHFDDAAETFLMNLLFEGRIGCFQPVTYLSRADVTQIRPLLYVKERQAANAAKRLGLPIVHNPCPANGETRRQEVKELLEELEGKYPNLRQKIFGAMQRSPLKGWETQELIK